MECIEASKLKREDCEAFFQGEFPVTITEKEINQYGYFIKEDRLQAFLMLVPLTEDSVQLKHLYMKEKLAPMYILAMIEICIQLVKKMELKHMYIYSEQDALNQLAQQLQFEQVLASPDNQQRPGKWWCISVDYAKSY
ncbi:hypothetical protein [Paraliobacillus salinarum]|uniref:hypothetical protein n=1 Tax=Paraliobacillus salinarum TaxID=1158996 RepID=UPI0015F549EA|nr:hypothetical protein [Paraliobacillus salinarum]